MDVVLEVFRWVAAIGASITVAALVVLLGVLARERRREAVTGWSAEAADLGLTRRISMWGCASAAGEIDGLRVNIRDGSLFPGYDDDPYDALTYTIEWATDGPQIDLIHAWHASTERDADSIIKEMTIPRGSRQRPGAGTPIAGGAVPGLRSINSNPGDLAEWLTPDRLAAIASVLRDQDDKPRRERMIEVSGTQLRVATEYERLNPASVETTLQQLVDAAHRLRGGSTLTV
jgi:hypothetical protein